VVVRKGERKANIVQKKWVHMRVNAKMILVKTVP
jgi:hypothetical protein